MADEARRATTRERMRRWRAANPEKVREAQRRYRNSDSYRRAQSAQFRRNHLSRCYGITPEQYEAMLQDQGGICAICGNPPGAKRLCVDHEHNTRKVRGLLCDSCNIALGKLRDDVALLRKAADYLERGIE